MPGPGQLVSIQALRALAAMMVLVRHAFLNVGNDLVAGVFPQFDTGMAGVDLFFVISGFVMVYASEPIFAQRGAAAVFWSRRILRIVPLYWAMTTLLVVYLMLRFGGVDIVGQTWQGVVASYLFLPYPEKDGTMAPVLAVGWTLQYEMFFYLVFGLAVCLPRRAAVLGASATLLSLCAIRGIVSLPGPLSYLSDLIIVEFIFGMLVALAYREGLRLPRVLALSMIALGVAAMGANFGFHWQWRALYWGLPATAIVAGCVFAGEPQQSKTWRAAAFLGDCSYALYLVHEMALNILRHLGINFAQAYPIAYCAFIIAVSVACGIAVHLFFERPLTIYLRGRLRGSWSVKLRST